MHKKLDPIGLVTRNARQLMFDTDLAEIDRGARLMRAMDRVNRDWGNETLRLTASGIKRVWKTKHGRLSPRDTTRWQDLITVRG